jgi:hypothetical protein
VKLIEGGERTATTTLISVVPAAGVDRWSLTVVGAFARGHAERETVQREKGGRWQRSTLFKAALEHGAVV